MAIFEGTHGNILQGVSQQIPRSRLEGQVSEQVNMVSDPVTGIRRRQGCRVVEVINLPQATASSTKAWRTEMAGSKVEFILNAATGELVVYENSKRVATLTSNYLKSNNVSTLRYTTAGESVYILNTSIVPYGVKKSPANGESVGESGFANFQAGALNREFVVSLRVSKPNGQVAEVTGKYTTPKGEQPEDVNKITPEYIAGQVYNSLVSQINSQGLGSSVQLTRSNAVIVAKSKDRSKIRMLANASDMYVVTSNLGNLKDVGRLPERMPDNNNGIMFSIGKDKGLRYYRFDEGKGAWVETAQTGGYTSLKNMPIEVYYDVDSSKWVLNEEDFPARLAGDEDNNPDPDFIGWGITGIAAYQGRLVLLSGSYVWLSASGLPRIFYRTTLEELLDSDPIGIGSSSATAASFQYAVNFNKDLILFSAEHQALIAGSNVAITPKTANVMVTSTYTADMSVQPISLGRSLMYPMPRSLNAYGVMEMIPSPYTDSMYISTDVTEHIPTYLLGRCRIAVSSTVGSIALFGSTACKRTLYVHEYVWEGDEKLLKAWHKWQFAKEVADVYFDGDLIAIMFVSNGIVIKTVIDPRSEVSNSEEITTFLDFLTEGVVNSSKVVTLEGKYNTFLGDDKLLVTHATGGLQGSLIGYDREGATLQLTKSTQAGKVLYGVPFLSELEPSPPIVRDQDGVPVTTNRLNLINYYCTTDRSGEYVVSIRDKARANLEVEYSRTPVQWLSTELSVGRTPIGGLSGDVVPCRVPADSSIIRFSTQGVRELNIISLEYVCKYNYRRQRR